MLSVELKPFGPEDLSLALSWFDDPETQRWLGDRRWLTRALELHTTQVGTWFRGALQTAAYGWLARGNDGQPVGYIDCAIFDRWTSYGGEGSHGPIILGTINQPAAALAMVVDPQRRRRGFGRAILKAVIDLPALSAIDVFGGGVDLANVGSIRCFESAGFVRERPEPDFEGMLYYIFVRE